MLKYKYNLAALALCLLFFSLALFSGAGFSYNNQKFNGNGILADEIPHIASGYYYLTTHRYFLNPEHPPLVKDIAGLGELVIHPKSVNITGQEVLPENFHRFEFPFQDASFPKALEWQNNQDHFGTMFLFNPENNPDKIAFWARLAVILANTLLLFLLYWLLKKLWSARAALLGLFFFSVSEFSIAHGSFVVIDFMSAITTVVAICAFSLYLKKFAEEEKTGKYFFLAGGALALALVSKFSSVVIVPGLFVGGAIYILSKRYKNYAKPKYRIFGKYIFAFAAIGILAIFLIGIFYAFHVYRMEDSMLAQKIHENYPEEMLPAAGHKILETMVYANVLTKGIAEYINGAFMVVSRMVVSAQNTYFLGHVYGNEGAGGRYFPVLYATKISLGLHLFSLLTLFFLSTRFLSGKKKLKEKYQQAVENPLSILLFVFAYLYMLVTLSSTFQIGLRHIMPVILCAAILTGRGTDLFWDKYILKFNFRNSIKFGMQLKHLFIIVAALMIFSVWNSFPYYLEYYNALGGGTDNGYKIATDSNYDWGGSDVRRLADYVNRYDIKKIYTQIFADVPLKYYLGERVEYFNLQDSGKLPPSGSYIAVSAFELMNNMYSWYIPPERKYSALGSPVARVGKTIFIFRVPQ